MRSGTVHGGLYDGYDWTEVDGTVYFRKPSPWATPFWLTVFTLPILFLLTSAIAIAGFVASHGARYRDLLETFFPTDWIAVSPGGVGRPGATAGVVAAAVVAAAIVITIVRRIGVRAWAAGARRRLGLCLWCFLTTALRTLVFVGAFAAIAGAYGIARAADLESTTSGGPEGWWPWALTAIGVAFWSLGSTLRSVAKAYTLPADGWTPPEREAGSPPPPQQLASPGPGWWLASDGRWYPPTDVPGLA